MLIVVKLFAKDQSEFDSPGLDSPMSSSSELEEEPEESELMMSHYLGWTLHRGHHSCETCFLCNTVCLLPFLPSPSILEAKIEDHVYNVVVFCAGTRLDWGATVGLGC